MIPVQPESILNAIQMLDRRQSTELAKKNEEFSPEKTR